MHFFKVSKKWKSELSLVGLSAGLVMFFLSFFVLGDPTIWLLVSCIPLLLPLIFGSWLKMKIPACLLIFVAGVFLWHSIESIRPIKTVSPGGTVIYLLPGQKNNNYCYIVQIGTQIFHTDASIYHKIQCVWKCDDIFILDSSDVGPIEFHKENGIWTTSSEHLHKYPSPVPIICTNELKQAWLVLMLYYEDHNMFPEPSELEGLIESENPMDNYRRKRLERLEKECPGHHYVYWQPQMPLSDNREHIPLMADAEPYHNGKKFVVFLDGKVELLTSEELESLIPSDANNHLEPK